MNLFIIRHGQAGHWGDPNYPDDSLRPLTEDGRARFGEMVKKLRSRGFAPSLVATSPYVRCRQTAEIIAAELGDSSELVVLDALAPGSYLEELMAWTAVQEATDVAWVGHAPDAGNHASALLGAESAAAVRFPKGAIAALRFEDEIQVGSGELRWLATAKTLGCD